VFGGRALEIAIVMLCGVWNGYVLLQFIRV
jgi:hypothetical protein